MKGNGSRRNNRALSLKRQRLLGYTLIEILVVLFIMSIVTTVALLSINQNENRQIATFANELSQMVMLAEEQAMLQPQVLGLSIANHHLQFTGFEAEKNGKPSHWVALDDTALGKRAIPGGIDIHVETGNKQTAQTDAANVSPQIIISTNGDVTPFTIYVGKKGKKPLYAITGDADGHVTTRQLS